MDVTAEQLRDLAKDSFEQGQIDGIKLACDQLSKAIQEYKTSLLKLMEEKVRSELCQKHTD